MAQELSALEVALAPPRAHGDPVASGVLRAEPEDFLVEEDLGFAPAGAGAHLLLKVRKRNANTQWVARELARRAGCRPGDVGYAGLKDRRAVAVQWFSVPCPAAPISWSQGPGAEFEVLEAHAHARKLPRGALAANQFTIRVGASDGDGARLAALLAPRLAEIARRGVPNYFGPQRFGRGGANLARLADDPGALRPAERGFVISAARSVIFNGVLAARVTAASWEQLLAGDLANLEGRGSVFAVEEPDADLMARCAQLQIHPTGPLWGRGTPATGGSVLEIESRVGAQYAAESRLCTAAGMHQERRSLRLAVHGLSCAAESAAVLLRFRLGRGGFATAVLRELITSEAAAE
jgi:tRNA pseudouridine13 synthase